MAKAVVDFWPPTLRAKYHLDDLVDPDIAKSNERNTKCPARENITTKLPKGWPLSLQSPLAWSTNSFHEESEHTYILSPLEIAEIDAALSRVKESRIDFDDIKKSTFVLPTLGASLQTLSHRVHNGCGFVVVRERIRLKIELIPPLVFPKYHHFDFEPVVHVTDAKWTGVNASERRPIFSNQAQPFHADIFCGVLGLYHLEEARSGGDTLLASSWTVYNELAATRPDIIHTLTQNDWVHDTFGCNPPYYQQPLLYNHAGKIILNFARRVLKGAPMTARSRDIRPMTEAQAEALDAVHFCALKHSLKVDMRSGDMCFVNNLAIMHSRSAFEDDEPHTRYVLRVWLNNPDLGWQMPPRLQLFWDRTFAPLDEVTDY
ncbi:hypothetical protein JMJ35_008580 [Cladonia borealis]|uniref:TauD/TfdA-like domain-containing protein n=1 Tax=Cladonia borealis TaxID=184061 RepID=A0AA39QWH3_9LECA|nr:hypothetical protein JMJ35_008580 [Cladonia borealis]